MRYLLAAALAVWIGQLVWLTWAYWREGRQPPTGQGMYYTPREIIDPAAGSGTFLLEPVNPPWKGGDGE